MVQFPKKLKAELENRHQADAFRRLKISTGLTDFSSNDYLGFARQLELREAIDTLLTNSNQKHGATGSRLLSGNHELYEIAEALISKIHEAEAALIFNSGYDANLGLISAVAQRGDLIIFDELCHASIRDGIRLSNARAVKFKHNDLNDLERIIKEAKEKTNPKELFIITESVFSMDGDSPELNKLAILSKKYDSQLIVDEAHAMGVFGYGLIQELGLTAKVFARIITFGKAMGCHGAVILGSTDLRNYLINFARSFIYTTALPPYALATIIAAYQYLKEEQGAQKMKQLQKNITVFKEQLCELGLDPYFIASDSAIQVCQISGNTKVKSVASSLVRQGFDVRPILSPTVPEGKERLRFCLHAFNTATEIKKVLATTKKVILDEN